MKVYEGNLVAEGIRVGVVCARFNEFIVSPDAPAPLRSRWWPPGWPGAGSTTPSSPWER